METFLLDLPRALPALAVTVFFVWLLWWAVNRTTRFDDHDELFVRNNHAFLVQRLALCAAQVIAMLAVIPDFDVASPWWSTLWLLAEGAWVFVALFVARYVVDLVLLPRIKNDELLREGNLAVGIVEAGFYIGVGFLLNGSLTGSADSFGLAVLSTVVFYLLGLGLVTAVFWIHEWVTSYHLRDALRDGDVAAALELAGVLVAACIVTKVGVGGDFTTWGLGLAWFFVTAGISLVLLYAVRWVSNRLILRRMTIRIVQERHQSAAAGMQAGLMILAALAVSTVIGGVL